MPQRQRSRFQILHKLLTLSGVLIGFLMLVGLVSYANLAQQRATIDTIVNEKFSNLAEISGMTRRLLTVHNELARVVRWVSLGYLSGLEAKQQMVAQAEGLVAIDRMAREQLSNLPPQAGERLIAQLGEYEEWIDQIAEIIDKDFSLAELYLGSADEQAIALVDVLAELEGHYGRESRRYFLKSDQRFSEAIVLFFVILALAVMVSAAIAYVISRSIVVPLSALASKASAISSRRDLTQQIRVDSNDEVSVLADAFNAMIRSLKEYYDDLHDSHERLGQTSQALEHLNRHLALEVARRTAEISQANADLKAEVEERARAEVALRDAKREAEDANRAKSAFLASMSHELRTPLNGILGYAQIMQRDRGLDHKHVHGVRIIRESGEHLLALINDILDMAKIEAGKLELAQADFALQPFFDGLVDLFRLRAKEKALGFQMRRLSELPEAVQGDERRLRQVCFNLLSNAFKFTDNGTITLEVGYRNHRLQVSVEDEGCGIADDKIDDIFEPFQQTGHFGNRSQGTGLGLPISKRLVEAMGGGMQVRSRLGQGSAFAFEVELPQVQAPVPEACKVGRTILGFEGGEYRILVVDDREPNRVLLMDLLSPLGFSLEGAVDGEEALAVARRQRPQLILLDLLMPVMDGFECARRLRQCPEHEETVIIAVSASVLDQQIHEAFAAGCDAFLPKPIQADALLGEIAKRLNLQWRYAEEADEPDGQAPSESVAPQAIAPPSREAVVELGELAAQGDILGVVDYVKARFEGNAGLQPFARRVQRLAESFQERELIAFLESFSDEHAPLE